MSPWKTFFRFLLPGRQSGGPKMTDENTVQSFPLRLRKVVDLVGSAEKLARAAGVSSRVIGKYLSGESLPGLANLVSMARAGDVRVEWLAVGDGPMNNFKAADRVDHGGRVGDELAGYLDVGNDTLEEISRLLKIKMGDRRSEISADKLILLMKTLYRFYSRNFIERAEFRAETLEKNVESLVNLAMPEKRSE
jgi:transcriptional regulator with XRE-family HTH domain